MAQPGWYADPTAPGGRRYWDGAAWAPLPPERPGRNGWWWWGGGLLVLALIVGLIIWQPWTTIGSPVGEDPRTARPSGSQWDELSPSPKPTPTAVEPSDGRPQACPDRRDGPTSRSRDGWFTSTGMSYQGVRGWQETNGWSLDFATDPTGQDDSVTSGWVAVTAMGGLDTTEFVSDPRGAATQVADCMATSYYYDLLESTELIEDRAFVTDDGVEGWLLRYNFWNVEGAPVVGDETVFLVLDAGVDGRLTLFHTQAPIGDTRRVDQVTASMESLRRS